MVFALVAGCADTPEREGSDKFECPSWKIEVVDNGRIYCVDRDIWEERDEEWK